MSYTPIYALVVCAVGAGAILIAYRIFRRWQGARDDRGHRVRQAHEAKLWANRNDPR